MSCPLNKDHLSQLKQFINVCKSKPELLHHPDLQFFKEYLISLGAILPTDNKQSCCGDEHPSVVIEEEPVMEEEKNDSEPESDLKFDMDGCVEPDILDSSQFMGDLNAVPTEEDIDKADVCRSDAMKEFSEGNFEKAVQLYTDAIKLNPVSALLYAKRGQAYLKMVKPNACIKDCTQALQLNCDSAAAYKFRGRAYRLIADWEKAAADLRQACNIDFDEQADEWLREVTPNARKLEQHKLKLERKKAEAELKAKQERIRKAREANAKAAAANTATPEPTAEPTTGGGGSQTNDFFQFLQDPEVMASFQDPEVAAAFQDISQNPANILKYQSNPKIAAVINKLATKLGSGGGMPPGFPGGLGGMAGMFGGAGGFPPTGPNGDDVGLD